MELWRGGFLPAKCSMKSKKEKDKELMCKGTDKVVAKGFQRDGGEVHTPNHLVGQGERGGFSLGRFMG